MHFPGFHVFAPITPKEYEYTWDYFMKNNIPMMCSEHRDTFTNTKEIDNILIKDTDITICAISATRLEAIEAIKELTEKNITSSLVNIFVLKPFSLDKDTIDTLKSSKHILVVDTGHETAGASQAIAYEIGKKTNKFIHILGINDKTKCLCEPFQNRYPNKQSIINKVKEILND